MKTKKSHLTQLDIVSIYSLIFLISSFPRVFSSNPFVWHTFSSRPTVTPLSHRHRHSVEWQRTQFHFACLHLCVKIILIIPSTTLHWTCTCPTSNKGGMPTCEKRRRKSGQVHSERSCVGCPMDCFLLEYKWREYIRKHSAGAGVLDVLWPWGTCYFAVLLWQKSLFQLGDFFIWRWCIVLWAVFFPILLFWCLLTLLNQSGLAHPGPYLGPIHSE